MVTCSLLFRNNALMQQATLQLCCGSSCINSHPAQNRVSDLQAIHLFGSWLWCYIIFWIPEDNVINKHQLLSDVLVFLGEWCSASHQADTRILIYPIQWTQYIYNLNENKDWITIPRSFSCGTLRMHLSTGTIPGVRFANYSMLSAISNL